MNNPLSDEDVVNAMDLIKRISWKYKDMKNLLSFEDMQQEGFIGYMRGRESFDETRGMSYKVWVTQNVVWAICQALTEENKQRNFHLVDEGFASYTTNDLGLQLKDVSDKLTAQEQQLLEMRFWEGKTQEECAKTFGVVQRTVGKWEAVILEKMRVRLSESGNKRADLIPDKGGRWPNPKE